jgi:hypothetical protein
MERSAGNGRRLHGAALIGLFCAFGFACGDDRRRDPVVGTDGGSGLDAGTDPGGSTVAGTITLPSDASGRCAMVAVDTDTTGSNGPALGADGAPLVVALLVEGASVPFSIDDVPAGSYFLWGYVDADASATSPPADCEVMGGPNSGDLLGYWDTGLGPPSAPNVTIPHAGGVSFDFELGVFP